MNRISLILPLLFLFGCGKVTTFELNNVKTSLIHQVKVDSVPCVIYKMNDSILRNTKNGVCFTFDVILFGNSGGIEPGIGGTKDSIISFNLFLESGQNRTKFTDTLYNLEQSLSYENFSRPYGYRCTCFDSLNSRYYNYVREDWDKKPTIYTYDKHKKQNIVYWANGDTSISKSPYEVDTLPYETFFTSIKDFVNSYNKLEINKHDNLNYKSFKIIDSGCDIERTNWYFWFPEDFAQKIKSKDWIITEIKLSNGRTLIDTLKIK